MFACHSFYIMTLKAAHSEYFSIQAIYLTYVKCAHTINIKNVKLFG